MIKKAALSIAALILLYFGYLGWRIAEERTAVVVATTVLGVDGALGAFLGLGLAILLGGIGSLGHGTLLRREKRVGSEWDAVAATPHFS